MVEVDAGIPLIHERGTVKRNSKKTRPFCKDGRFRRSWRAPNGLAVAPQEVVPGQAKAAYVEAARKSWQLFKEYGALQQFEAWGDKVPDGKVTDFKRSVDLKDGETVVFAWVLWPDKATADACEASGQTDPRWRQMDMPFDGRRMIFGGFETIFDEEA